MLQWIAKIDRALVRAEEVALALLLVGVVVLAALQVVLRNVWGTALDWADGALQNTAVLIGLIGAGVATSEGRHLSIDAFGRLLNGRGRFLLRVVIGIFGVLICVTLAKGGWDAFHASYGPWADNIPAQWGVWTVLIEEVGEGLVPQWLTQLMFPLGFGLIALHFALRLLRDASSLWTDTPWEKEIDVDYADQVLAAMEVDASPSSRSSAALDEVDTPVETPAPVKAERRLALDDTVLDSRKLDRNVVVRESPVGYAETVAVKAIAAEDAGADAVDPDSQATTELPRVGEATDRVDPMDSFITSRYDRPKSKDATRIGRDVQVKPAGNGDSSDGQDHGGERSQ